METEPANAQNNWNTMNTTDGKYIIIRSLPTLLFLNAAHQAEPRDRNREGSRRIHGHTYIAEVAVHGEVNTQTGVC